MRRYELVVGSTELPDATAIQETGYWEGIGLAHLEEMRLRLRFLVPFLDRKKRTIVCTDFQDQVLGVRDEEAVYMPKMRRHFVFLISQCRKRGMPWKVRKRME